ncbi:MAG: hypothetical protein QOE70_4609 [Chthoniobacter sp.]|jgi:uncharacterized protein (TIGR02600 family)|nr:hypothetical protein [Chthoniobacter sp.]
MNPLDPSATFGFLHGTVRSRGIALVLVLAFLVIISGLILAFFANVTTESATATNYADGATARMLADSTLNLVQAQIRDATRGQDATNASSILAWASQPGTIRTFDPTGKSKDVYKLYSANNLVVSAADFAANPDPVPNEWRSNPNQYVDLNAPGTMEGASTVPGAATVKKLVYPILDPAAVGFVDGFAITSPPGYIKTQSASAENNPAPMPVKWLYLLQDGTFAPASAVDANTVSIIAATATNPIIGRVAFWTDDETSKVNINTASEGTYWDVPRVYSREDYGQASGGNANTPGMAVCQPVQHEYQRYPGHPATTCLSPIFGKIPGLAVPYPFPLSPSASDASQLDPYYNLAPRIGLSGGGGSGGSRGGLIQIGSNDAFITADTDRLYASVDELMFTPRLFSPPAPQLASRIPNTAPSNSAAPKLITKDVLDKARFFITANSAAPETTLFNTPRVAIWPVWADPSKRTPYDALMAFCSTIGGQSYYFTRSNPRSSTADLTPRNFQLYQYLQALTAANVPGFGGNFLKKWEGVLPGVNDRDQILTLIYDYIRCTSLQDRSAGATPYTTPFNSTSPPAGAGEVIPIRIGGTQGFGRFYSITSANLLFYGTHRPAAPANTIPPADKMRAVFFLGLVTPMQGLGCMRSNLKYKVSGLQGFQAQGKNLNFKFDGVKGNGTNYIDITDLSLFHGRSVGGTESPWQAIRGKAFNDADAGGDLSGRYPFFSEKDVDVTGADFSFISTSDVVVEIWTRDTNQLVQTVRFSFPSGQFKVPTSLGAFGARTGGDYSSLVVKSGTAPNEIYDTVVALQVGGWDTKANTNRPEPEVDFTAGDNRMTACLPDVPTNRFRADNSYKIPQVKFAHCLVQSVGEFFNGAKYGKLANVVSYTQTYAGGIMRQPDVPSRVWDPIRNQGYVTRNDGGPGDWDTGFGDQKDGAYINKPDEGDTALTDITNGQNRLPYSLGYGAGFASATGTYFSPNRQVPSPMMFGSIPTGVQRMLPWQTLLFHPRPEDSNHPGFGTPRVPGPGESYKLPPDHLLADLFWMPVIEPYAISQPFATSGKINMNYQIMPFTYINRSTAMQAVMKSTKFAAIPLSEGERYKPLDAAGKGVGFSASNCRQPIDMVQTLKAFDNKFKNNEIFKSATQICEIDLVPPGQTITSMAGFWNANKLTGDNLREKPYVDLYPRLTTKSNTFTVHVRVQALKKARNTPPNQWVSGRDQVVSEYRGSSIVERYIDVNDPRLPDFAKGDPVNIDQFYRMRVISTHRFSP